MPVVQQWQPPALAGPGASRGRPVLLATLDVPFDRAAVVVAVETAVELGQRLIVANFVEQLLLPLSASMGYDDLPYPPKMAESMAAPARLARSLGVEVVRLRVKSLHPIQAIVEVTAEEDAGLLVFGPDLSRLRRWRYRRASRVIRNNVSTLIWLPD